MISDFIAYLEEQVANGSIYVLGAQGQTGSEITEAWIKMREHNISKNYTRAIAFWKKRLAEGYAVLCAYDCSGLGMYWLYNLKRLYTGDLTAHGMYGKCEAITRDKLRKGDWVFRKNSLGRKYHVGYVVDDAINVIECKGRDDGVVKRPLNASGVTYWNCYGRPKIFKTEIEESEDMDVLQRGDTNNLVEKWQDNLLRTGYELPKYGADSDFGSETEAATNSFKLDVGLEPDGIVDGETWAEMADVRADVEAQANDAEIDMLQSKINAAKSILG